ncbi:Dihydroorotase [Cupriavidus yeoncheonensis]|uniref:Dihydroorotase n=1 Tax=Cupriavidus yeoncheonensis TaxID=1462994 RepID=A0A916IXI4_9BURK|nr:dihydroorotase [Cupriavidus yeoncheonensis]CAG2151833.1 Dihydroorotase [Cupriavidus yeoncheonensis]
MTVSTLTIRRPDDWHLHLRDGDMLRAVLPASASQYGRAIVMPNLRTPVTTAEAAVAYRERIESALPRNAAFRPMMTCYLCDTTDPAEVRAGFDGGAFAAAKLYPAGATTHAEYGVTSVDRIAGVLAVMQEIGMPLLVHGESTDPTVDVFDREANFLRTTLTQILASYPRLKVVLEHITTEEAADFVMRDASGRLAATITPQHLMFNRNAMFSGGIRPHYYCLPVLKREHHRQALRRAATSGSPAFFLGTDSAPHDTGAKESACGCAGIFSAPVALQAYLTVFEEERALHRFEAFASENGANFYGVPPNRQTMTFHRTPMQVTGHIDLPDGRRLQPFLAGETLPWSLASFSQEIAS